ncbi:MAG: hypothetical protein IPF94_20345 [Betaproteobacteria bacterium]|nr:hypothetical protein [Betaproteobacteria bacterium]
MASSDALERAYAAIARLRQQGVARPSVDAVAEVAGLARSSFYQKDDEWSEVRAVIKGKASPRVKLVEMMVSDAQKATSRVSDITERVAKLEEDLANTNKYAEEVYQRLIDQVQYYFARADESPKKLEQSKKQINELKQARHDLQLAQTELIELRRESQRSNVVKHRVLKKIVKLPAAKNASDLFSVFLDELDRLFPDAASTKTISGVYVVCGYPKCGKTDWINRHEPANPGIALYIEGTNHTRSIRSFLTGRLRKLTSQNISCVWIDINFEVVRDRCRNAYQGLAHVEKEDEIQTIQKELETVALSEDFDQIYPVRSAL